MGAPPRLEGMSEQEDLSPEEIARLDKAAYKEPGRDLMATRPVEPRGEGAVGDEPNPVAEERTHGTSGDQGFGGTRGARHFDRKKT